MQPIRYIERQSNSGSFDIGTSVAASSKLEMQNKTGGMIYIPSGHTMNLSFYSSPDNTTYYTIYDKNRLAITRIASGINENISIPLPDEAYGAGYLAIVGDNAKSAYYTIKG